MDPSNNQDLIEHLTVLRAQLGEPEAFSGLFERYNARLLYYLRRLVPASSAEDVLQEVWITVVKKVATLEQPQAFKAWIYRIAHNRAISKLRRDRHELSLDDLDLDLEPSTEAEDELAFAGYGAADLHAGLERLSPPHREVLTLRFLDEFSYEEIARIVGCRVGTVRSRIHYARKSLHAELTRGSEPTRRRKEP